MALEPVVATGTIAEDPELAEMWRRFRFSAVLALPLLLLSMVHDLAPVLLPGWAGPRVVQWVQFLLAMPVVLWGGWPRASCTRPLAYCCADYRRRGNDV
jgi:Cu+-exporting ATPase